MIYFVIGYFVIAFISYGIFFAYWQRKFPYFENDMYCIDMIASIFFAITWPGALSAHYINNFHEKKFYGFKWF